MKSVTFSRISSYAHWRLSEHIFAFFLGKKFCSHTTTRFGLQNVPIVLEFILSAFPYSYSLEQSGQQCYGVGVRHNLICIFWSIQPMDIQKNAYVKNMRIKCQTAPISRIMTCITLTEHWSWCKLTMRLS